MDDPRIAAFKKEVDKILAHLHGEFAKLQTGRANAMVLESIMVEAYGIRQPLKAVGGISVQDARTLVVQPWDKSVIANIEKSLSEADLGAMPVNDGVVIRITLPPMTEDRRKQLGKVVHQLSEDARVSIRRARQEAHDAIKTEEKDEDRRYTLLETLEKEVKTANDKIEESRKKKDEEIMTV